MIPSTAPDTRFIGNPIDFVVFHGYTRVKDKKGNGRCRDGGSEDGEGEAYTGRDADRESGL